jgi:ketopantoate reductase
MERIDRWRETLREIIQRYADIPDRYTGVSTYLLVSNDLNHYMLMQEGWYQKQRFHGAIIHAEIRDDKIWIHYDGVEDGITDELVAAGVPKENIVLAFHPPYVRCDTGYAVA